MAEDLYFRVKVGLRHSDGAGVLERRLGDPRAYTYVPDLWDWFVQKHPEGQVVGPDAAFLIARGAGWMSQDEDKFCAALVAAGFLAVIPEGFRVKGWREWAGFHLEVRAKERAKKQAQRTDDGHPKDVPGTSPGQVDENKAPDGTCPGDSSQISDLGSASEGVQGEIAQRPFTPFVAFLRDAYPQIKNPWKSEAAWVKAYPGVDLLAEALRAQAWEVANPHKPKKNKAAFLNRWFANATPAPPKAPEPPPLPTLDAEWLEGLPAGERVRALTEWRAWSDDVQRRAYPDALPRLMAEAAAQFQAEWEPLPVPVEVA